MNIEQIKAQVSVADALEMLDLPSPRSGSKILCPVHADVVPSLVVYEDWWYCHGCGRGGDVLNLVEFVTGARPYEARRFLSGAVDEFAATPRVQHQVRELVDLTEEYVRARSRDKRAWVDAGALFAEKWPHLSLAELDEHGWVAVGAHALLVPHWYENRVVGIKTRSTQPGNRGTRNAFKGSTFTSQLYWVKTRLHRGSAVLVEGESDCWTMQAHTPGDVYALPAGVATWRPSFGGTLAGYEEVVLFLDHDDPGQRMQARLNNELSNSRLGAFPCIYEDVTEAVIDGWRPEL